MSRLATSFVLGYHGCDGKIAERAIAGDFKLVESDRDYDWLGPGAYFWEGDPTRAREWAAWKSEIGHYERPAVIGAVIDLRNCLDLLARDDIELLATAYESFAALRAKAEMPMPVNRGLKGQTDQDRVLRYLDCAVIRHLHEMIAAQASDDRGIEPLDTVRGMFTEGGPLYPGCGFEKRSHVQIAVRNDACIKGFFWPR